MESTASVKLWWTDAMDETVKAMWADGDSMKQIGYTVGRSRCSVAGRISRLGLPKRKEQNGAQSARTQHKRVLVKRPVPVAAKQTIQRLHIRPSQAPVVVTHAVHEGATYEAPATRKTLLELGPHDCRWPCWNAFETDQFFCGAPQVDGKSYCPTHCAIAYAPTPRLTNARVRYNEAVAA